jgi:hypothetical protein
MQLTITYLNINNNRINKWNNQPLPTTKVEEGLEHPVDHISNTVYTDNHKTITIVITHYNINVTLF